MIKVVMIFSMIFFALHANEYGVIISKKNPIKKISKKQLKDIFLKKRHYIGEQKVIPVNISAAMEMRIDFEESILKMNRKELNGFWTKQHFQGVTPPTTQSSHNSIKLFVKNVEGAIGYLPLSLVDDEIKVLHEF